MMVYDFLFMVYFSVSCRCGPSEHTYVPLCSVQLYKPPCETLSDLIAHPI